MEAEIFHLSGRDQPMRLTVSGRIEGAAAMILSLMVLFLCFPALGQSEGFVYFCEDLR